MVREQVNNFFLRALTELAEAIKADLLSESIDMGRGINGFFGEESQLFTHLAKLWELSHTGMAWGRDCNQESINLFKSEFRSFQGVPSNYRSK